MDQIFLPAYMATPAMMATPLFSTPGYHVPTISTVIPTGYTPFQPMPPMSAASSLASIKQQSRAEVVSRTVHLRCLPPSMKQRELADVFDLCGEYLRVRICGNAATHQKWVYGFVEFATTEAAAAMLTHSGMELSNGADKPPLRLKCSPSKQPILDCMAYDADVVSGTPCGFGRGHVADCTLNDALLVVGTSSSSAMVPAGATTLATGQTAPAVASPVNSNLNGTTETVSVHSGVKMYDDASLEADGGGNRSTTQNSVTANSSSGLGNEFCSPLNVGAPSLDGVRLAAPAQPRAIPLEALKSTSFTQLVSGSRIGNVGELDVMQQLAAAFQGLRTTAAAEEGPLDGPAMVRRAETMALDALTRASHLSSDTRIQDILCDLGQLLSFLDGGAAVTGGAAQTASGDCTATLPQRVTQLRMLANLVGALLCLLRRSVADAVPYVEAVLVTFAQIPPSSLLLRARQKEHSGNSAAPANAAAKGMAPPAYTAEPSSAEVARRREQMLALHRGVNIDESVTDALLHLIDDGEEDQARVSTNNAFSPGASSCQHVDPFALSNTIQSAGHPPQQAMTHSRASLPQYHSSVSSPSDQSIAFLDSTDQEELLCRDVHFSSYTLHVLVSIGVAMEGVQPALSRGAYTLVNRRAADIFGAANTKVVHALAAPSVNPHLLESLFPDAAREGCGRDVAFFPRRFFETVKATCVAVRDARGTEGFYRFLPPNYVVSLFEA